MICSAKILLILATNMCQIKGTNYHKHVRQWHSRGDKQIQCWVEPTFIPDDDIIETFCWRFSNFYVLPLVGSLSGVLFPQWMLISSTFGSSASSDAALDSLLQGRRVKEILIEVKVRRRGHKRKLCSPLDCFPGSSRMWCGIYLIVKRKGSLQTTIQYTFQSIDL